MFINFDYLERANKSSTNNASTILSLKNVKQRCLTIKSRRISLEHKRFKVTHLQKQITINTLLKIHDNKHTKQSIV